MSDRKQEAQCHAPGGVNVSQVNVSQLERLATAVIGGWTVLRGLRQIASDSPTAGLLTTGVGGYLAYRAYTGHCHLYEKLNADTPGPLSHPFSRDINVEQTITINRDVEDLYAYWKDITKLPEVMRHIKQVERLDDRRSRWTVNGPGNVATQWEAVLIEEEPNKRLAWVTVEGGHVDHRGSVSFRPAGEGRGTIVEVRLTYRPVGGAVAAVLARLFRSDPDLEIRDDLRRFKQFMETGEIADNTSPSARDAVQRTPRAVSEPATASPEVDAVMEASLDSFPASDPPSFAGR